MLAAFRRGEEVCLPNDHAWLQRVGQHTRVGKRMQRVRLISHPLSDYLRFELSMYPQCIEAGEDVRVADLGEHPELLNFPDYWLFDDSTAIMLRYDGAGRFLDTDEMIDCTPYLRLRDLALSRSMELSEYTARTTR